MRPRRTIQNSKVKIQNIKLSPRQELGPAATPFCRDGRCAACYPRGPQAAKKILDYDLGMGAI